MPKRFQAYFFYMNFLLFLAIEWDTKRLTSSLQLPWIYIWYLYVQYLFIYRPNGNQQIRKASHKYWDETLVSVIGYPSWRRLSFLPVNANCNIQWCLEQRKSQTGVWYTKTSRVWSDVRAHPTGGPFDRCFVCVAEFGPATFDIKAKN